MAPDLMLMLAAHPAIRHSTPGMHFPNLDCPCCTRRHQAAAANLYEIAIGCDNLKRNINRLLASVRIVERRSDELRGLIGERLNERDFMENQGKHWHYITKLNTSESFVQSLLERNEDDVWPFLYRHLLKYLKYINFINEDELLWAGYRTGLRQRLVTFQDVISVLEIPHLASLHCHFYQVLQSKSIPIQGVFVEQAEVIVYNKPNNKRMADIRAFIIMNSFVYNYLEFVQMYAEKYEASLQCL